MKSTVQEFTKIEDSNISGNSLKNTVDYNFNVSSAFSLENQIEQSTTQKANATSTNLNLHSIDLSSINNNVPKAYSEPSNDDVDSNDLTSKLRYWATIQHKISQSAFTDLLHILSMYHPELPLDSRTIF